MFKIEIACKEISEQKLEELKKLGFSIGNINYLSERLQSNNEKTLEDIIKSQHEGIKNIEDEDGIYVIRNKEPWNSKQGNGILDKSKIFYQGDTPVMLLNNKETSGDFVNRMSKTLGNVIEEKL